MLLGVSFAILNAHPVSFNYYLASRELPLSILLVSAFIIGILLGILVMIPNLLKHKFEIRRLRRQDKGS